MNTHLSTHSLLRLGLPHRDLPQISVIDIHGPVDGDRVGVDVEAREIPNLFVRELFWFDVIWEPQLDQTPFLNGTEHSWVPRLFGNKSSEESVVGLRRFVEAASIDGGGDQVVGSGDGVDVSGQMQIELVHRNDLRVAAARCATFDPEGGTLTRLPNASDDVLVEFGAQSLRKADHRGALAFAKGSGRDARDSDVFAFQPVQAGHGLCHLRLVGAVEVVLVEANLSRQLNDWLASVVPDNFDITANNWNLINIRM